MAGQHKRVVGEREQARRDTFHKRLVIAPGKVGAAYGAAEKTVARKYHPPSESSTEARTASLSGM